MTTVKKLRNRLSALAKASLPPEMLVPELSIELHRAIGTDPLFSLPYVLVSDPAREAPHEFRVLRGSESNTDEIRALLQMGIWPAPSTIPSLHRLITERMSRTVFAAPLWGEGCNEEGPWTPLWRERNIRQGYYVIAFAPSGRVVATLISRGPDAPPFARAEIALGEEATRLIGRAIDRQPDHALPCDTLVDEVPVAFGVECRIASIGMYGQELLRDIGGGGPGARQIGHERVEKAARNYWDGIVVETMTRRAQTANLTPDSTVEGAGFRQGYLQLSLLGPARSAKILPLEQSAYGAFDISVIATYDGGEGHVQALGTLRRRVPRMLALIRGLVETDVPGREIELAVRLCAATTLNETASAMGITTASAKTLMARLSARFDAHGRERLLDAIVALGCSVRR